MSAQHTDLLFEQQAEKASTYRKICLLHVIKDRAGIVVNVHGLRKTRVLRTDRAALHLNNIPGNKTGLIHSATPFPCWTVTAVCRQGWCLAKGTQSESQMLQTPDNRDRPCTALDMLLRVRFPYLPRYILQDLSTHSDHKPVLLQLKC